MAIDYKWQTKRTWEHSTNIGKLIAFLNDLDIEVTIADSRRGACCQIGIYGYDRPSLHRVCSATDLDLWVDGDYCDPLTHWAYDIAGEEWERLGGHWGGRFRVNGIRDVRHMETR